MNNKVVYNGAFGLLIMAGMIFGMELDTSKPRIAEFFSLYVKKNGPCSIKKCTIDDSKATTIMVRESELIHNLVKTTRIHYEKVKKVEDINFAILGPLLDKREKFHLAVNNNDKEKYLIDQVTVKSWPIQLDEIIKGKYGSIGKYFTSDSVVYDLHDNTQDSDNSSVMNCVEVNDVEENITFGPFTTVALIALAAYICRKNPLDLTLFPKFLS